MPTKAGSNVCVDRQSSSSVGVGSRLSAFYNCRPTSNLALSTLVSLLCFPPFFLNSITVPIAVSLFLACVRSLSAFYNCRPTSNLALSTLVSLLCFPPFFLNSITVPIAVSLFLACVRSISFVSFLLFVTGIFPLQSLPALLRLLYVVSSCFSVFFSTITLQKLQVILYPLIS